jgi:hypothetical protein
MSEEEVTDDMLMALSDGELGDAEVAALRARVAADAQLAARFAEFETSRAAARTALKPVMHAPPPDRLVAAIRDFRADDGKVVRLSNWARARSAFSPMSMAAGLLLAIFAGGVGGYVLRGGAQSEAAWSAGPPIAQRDLVAALSDAPSDEVRMWRARGETGAVTMLSSYRLEDNESCRAFEVTSAERLATGLACSAGGDWRVVVANVEPAAGDSYTPAADDALANLDAFLGARGALRLEPGEEAELIARGWRERE